MRPSFFCSAKDTARRRVSAPQVGGDGVDGGEAVEGDDMDGDYVHVDSVAADEAMADGSPRAAETLPPRRGRILFCESCEYLTSEIATLGEPRIAAYGQSRLRRVIRRYAPPEIYSSYRGQEHSDSSMGASGEADGEVPTQVGGGGHESDASSTGGGGGPPAIDMAAFRKKVADIAASVLEREKARIDAETNLKLLTLGKELAASELHSRRLRAQMDAVISEGNKRRMCMLKDGIVGEIDRVLGDCFQQADASKPWFYGLENKTFDMSIENALLGLERNVACGGSVRGNYNSNASCYAGARAMCDNKGKGVMGGTSNVADPLKCMLSGEKWVPVSRSVGFTTPTMTCNEVVNLVSGSSSAGPAFDSYPPSDRINMNLPTQKHPTLVNCGLGGDPAHPDMVDVVSAFSNMMGNEGGAAMASNAELAPLPDAIMIQDMPAPGIDQGLVEQIVFALSPFDVGLRHQEVPDELVMECYESVHLCESSELKKIWFHHVLPWLIRMKGTTFKEKVKHNVPFDIQMMETGVRLFNEKEIAMPRGFEGP